MPLQGGHIVDEKNSSFPGFSRAIIILLQRLSKQNQKYCVILIKLSQTTLLMISHNKILPSQQLFYANTVFDHTNTISVIIFPSGCTEFSENSMSFPCLEKSMKLYSRFSCTILLSTTLPNSVRFSGFFHSHSRL